VNGTAVDAKAWEVLPLIEWSAGYLLSKEFESPRLTAELLLCDVLSCRRIELYTNFDKVLTAAQLAQFKSHLKRRLGHEPVQYIVGSTDFMGLRFAVDSRTLIPRPETELLVEQVVARARAGQGGALRILDIGTGSGNIAVSLAKLLPEAAVVGIDVSRGALEAARGNALLHGVEGRVTLLEADVCALEGIPGGTPFDYLVSNPPYIAEAEVAALPPEIREYEPLGAVRVDGDGLAFYRVITAAAKMLLKPEGWIFLEVGFGQHEAVRAILADARCTGIAAVRDYGGVERIVQGRLGG
jgi:release factor glutamine methyltransferase